MIQLQKQPYKRTRCLDCNQWAHCYNQIEMTSQPMSDFK